MVVGEHCFRQTLQHRFLRLKNIDPQTNAVRKLSAFVCSASIYQKTYVVNRRQYGTNYLFASDNFQVFAFFIDKPVLKSTPLLQQAVLIN